MTTNLLNPSGTDFDNLFESGAGNQLLYIYASDGKDIGQKYLNVSYGSTNGTATNFLASDGADVQTKLCGKGKTQISYSIWFQDYGKDVYVSFSNIPPNLSVSVTGNYRYTWSYYNDSTERDESGTSTVNVSVSCGNGNTRVIEVTDSDADSYGVTYNLTFTCTNGKKATINKSYHSSAVTGTLG
jgi:hypothetical protein